jgi:hypothetical protein
MNLHNSEWTLFAIVSSFFLWIITATVFLFLWSHAEWDSVYIATMARLKLTQCVNILMLWSPVVVFDYITPRRTMSILCDPETPMDKIATAILFGCIFLASGAIICWGS